MEVKYYVVLGAVIGGVIGAGIAKVTGFHMGLTVVFFFGLGFLAVERQIRSKLPA